MSFPHTVIDFQPAGGLPPLRLTVAGERVTPARTGDDYAEAFAAWCHAAAEVLARRHAAGEADRAAARLRPRLEAWWGPDFAERKLRRLTVGVRADIAVVPRPPIERELLIRCGALSDRALAASVEEHDDGQGAA